ncbi:hypothetical protein K469DRAFT_664084 [Zopfia rhizophila CBS 207.26]|uniref:Fumarylacetoacetase-like C-terminal domain-containing protein n=1 Tax=Zopfia rhizophila CBS 207.26 TaxID=1314779 RepID=A0A6A6E7T6_9PEZI|nr:hypothetical protein K469DRAFT_664084 [Zopfia rhizophila CBS 207.26]
MSFSSLVRFDFNGQPSYGDLLETNENSYVVRKLDGNIKKGFATTVQTVTVQKLLCPLEHAPIIQCVGLNYRKHATEANLPIPTYPVIFTKPSDALAGPFDDVHIHPDAQKLLDYEGELCVIIARDAKNISASSALDYVLGYSVGNDVSARNFQLSEASGGQFGYAKSFDGFAPIGPAIWSPSVVPDPQKLRYKTFVNDEVVQETGTDDMIWDVKSIIAHLSRGTTLRAETIIMTGTPSGVGIFSGRLLKDGDIVKVEVEGLGSIANKMVFDR